MNLTGMPSYVVHVQVEHEYEPPTRKTTVVNMWWSDLYAIFENRKRVAPRRGEEKRAIYFKPRAFKPIDTFGGEVKTGGYKNLAARLAAAQIELIA